jgi:hypothetical protein
MSSMEYDDSSSDDLDQAALAARKARRAEIAASLVELGFISDESAHSYNPAVDVLASLLPADATVRICVSCHGAKTDEPFAFAEQTGVFPRPTPRAAGRVPFGAMSRVYTSPIPRTEIVLCTDTALMWTRSEPIIGAGGRAEHDTVTLISAPFAHLLGSTVFDRHKGEIEVWVEDGPTLTITVTPSEVEAVSADIDQQARSQ